jgi:hypothetical protein
MRNRVAIAFANIKNASKNGLFQSGHDIDIAVLAIATGILLQRALTVKAKFFVEGDRPLVIRKDLQFETRNIALVVGDIKGCL